MSSRHLGLDDGTDECDVFGSVQCRYGAGLLRSQNVARHSFLKHFILYPFSPGFYCPVGSITPTAVICPIGYGVMFV